MKKQNVLLLVMLTVSVNLLAQRSVDAVSEKQAARLKSELSLSDQQLARFVELNKKFKDDQLRMRSDTSLTRERIMAERNQMMEARNREIKKLLTKEQHEKWMAMKPAQGREKREPQRRGNPVEDLKKELGINDEQARKIVSINTKMGAQFQRLRSDTTVTRENRGKAMSSIVEARNEEVRKILTEEQFTNFLVYQKQKAKERRGGGRRPGR
jgi:periplasmic protein CpxP/Spy